MKVEPSGIEGVDLIGPKDPEFATLLGSNPDPALRPALPYSVFVRNRTGKTIAFLGVRFDMRRPGGKPCASMHYADALRNPEHAQFTPGVVRFISIEHGFTDAVLRGDVPALSQSAAYRRMLLNLDNVRKMLSVKASIDCVAFADGQFAGPDLGGAFARLNIEREKELSLGSQSLPPRIAISRQIF